jgi:hypothetical protein
MKRGPRGAGTRADEEAEAMAMEARRLARSLEKWNLIRLSRECRIRRSNWPLMVSGLCGAPSGRQKMWSSSPARLSARAAEFCNEAGERR